MFSKAHYSKLENYSNKFMTKLVAIIAGDPESVSTELIAKA